MNKLNLQKIKTVLENSETDFYKVQMKDRDEEYTDKYVNLLTEEQIIECLQYIQEDDEGSNEYKLNFLNTIESLDYVKAKYVGQEYMYDEQPAPTNTYRIRISRNGKSINFKFHNSYMDTMKGHTVNLYDILSCIASDGRMELDTFEEFCDSLGYDVDSIKVQKQYKEAKKQQEKVLKIFSDDELVDFPN